MFTTIMTTDGFYFFSQKVPGVLPDRQWQGAGEVSDTHASDVVEEELLGKSSKLEFLKFYLQVSQDNY